VAVGAARRVGLVEPADRVVQVRDGQHVVGGPAVVEPVGPHAGEPAPRQLVDLLEGELVPLVHHDGIEFVVVRPGAGARIEEWDGLVQVVPHHGPPVQERLDVVLREALGQHHAVAVVVVRRVLPPVGQSHRAPRQLERLGEAVDVHRPVTPVHLEHRRDQGDDVLADRPHVRGLLHREPVGQLHQHLRAARLRRVDRAGEPVDRLRRPDEAVAERGGQSPGIGQPGQHPPVVVEPRHGRLVGDGEQDHLASLVARAEREQTNAGRRLCDRAEVAVDVGDVAQPTHRPGDIAQHRERRRHRRRGRQVVHQLGRELPDRIGRRERADRGAIGGVEGLLGGDRGREAQRERNEPATNHDGLA
jgi:hypothetical protein